MNMARVKSSNLAAVGYDPTKRQMRIAFKGGGSHDYSDVPPEAHAALMSAQSHGKHFHKHIKSRFKSAAVE